MNKNKKSVKFNNKVYIKQIPEHDQYKYYKLKEIDKNKIYNLYDVNYSRDLMRKYDIIQNQIFKLLNKHLIDDIYIYNNQNKGECGIKINRDDVFWTEDNSPISFMKHILDISNLNKFCESLDKFIKNNMNVGDVKRIKYLYKPFVIKFYLLKRIR